MNEKQAKTITFSDWFKEKHSEDEVRESFLYIDTAMKFLHDRDMCVKTFDPEEIEILNDSVRQIKFNTLIQMPNDNIIKSKLKKEDIFNSAMLQVGLYSNCLNDMNPDFVKENFDDFIPFLPESDVGYYRGILQNGAAIYFTDFEIERLRRKRVEIEEEVNEADGKKVSYDDSKESLNSMFSNDAVNNAIYGKINKKELRDEAFLHVLIYPAIFIVSLLVMLLIMFVLKNYGV